MKNAIYTLYRTEISKLIAKVEVYVHDLPRQVCGIIENIFRCLASAESKDDSNIRFKIYEIAYKYEIFLVNVLHITLIYVYKKRIKKYKMTFKQFKYGGIRLENDVYFMDKLNDFLKEGNHLLKDGRKKFIELYRLNFWETLFYCNQIPWLERFFQSEIQIGATVNNKIDTLEKSYITYGKAIALCEDNYARIIANGYQATLMKRIIGSIPGVISFVVTLITAIILIAQ